MWDGCDAAMPMKACRISRVRRAIRRFWLTRRTKPQSPRRSEAVATLSASVSRLIRMTNSPIDQPRICLMPGAFCVKAAAGTSDCESAVNAPGSAIAKALFMWRGPMWQGWVGLLPFLNHVWGNWLSP